MSITPPTDPAPDEPIEPAPPAFDREAARARYRKLMRSWPMRLTYLLLALTILFAWGWGIAAAVAPDVELLPGHDITVPTAQCIDCHTAGAVANGAPPMSHPSAPSCGFCHRQGPPPAAGAHRAGWARPATAQANHHSYALH
jgi:hypothetical protein